MPQPQVSPSETSTSTAKKSFGQRLNTFKNGFLFGIILALLGVAGAGHLFLNVFRFGAVTIGDRSFGKVGSPTTISNTDDANIEDSENATSSDIDAEDTAGTFQTRDGDNNAEGAQIAGRDVDSTNVGLEGSNIQGETVTVTINYDSNAELPGFDPGQGYQSPPPDISQFDDAILINNVSLGASYVAFETREIFINRKKYSSTFSIRPDQSAETRVSFSLDVPGIDPEGIFLQFGLKDLDAGDTTLTYLVKIYGDGQILWSDQVKYEESQIASVVLRTNDMSDIVIEYQVVETGGINPYNIQNQFPIFFTEAKLLS